MMRTAWLSIALFLFGPLVSLNTQIACTPAGGDNPLVDASNPGAPDNSTNTDNSTTNNSSNGGGAPSIRGRLTLAAPASNTQLAPANGREVAFTVTEGCVVVAVSDQTQAVYRATVDSTGSFDIHIPDAEAGHTFVLTILGPDGKPLGPILMAVSNGNGLTGLKPAGEVNLGNVEIPANLGSGPILPGADSNITPGDVDSSEQTRLGTNNVAVGVNSFGKGAAALGGSGGGALDADKDGLVDLFDADDDGNGTVDDLEANASSWELPPGADARANFFTNLKISVEDADVYYHGTPEQIDAALATQTVVTFEVLSEPSSTKHIAGAHILSSPAPAYLPAATLNMSSQLWSLSDYALNHETDRYDAFAVPNSVMAAGDTFTVEVTFDDSSTVQYSRMLNYILKNIPRLVNYGVAGSLQAYDPGTPPALGTFQNPVLFDGTQPLTLEFKPPTDETGAYLTGFTYAFHLFFYDAGGMSINNIDTQATWPTPIANLQGTQYRVNASDPRLAALSADNTYTLDIPAAVLPTQVTLNGGSTVTVAKYKIDITAECPSGNSAITILFAKQ